MLRYAKVSKGKEGYMQLTIDFWIHTDYHEFNVYIYICLYMKNLVGRPWWSNERQIEQDATNTAINQ